MSRTSALSGERGTALIVVLAFMVFAVPVITAALSFASTVSMNSGAQSRSIIKQYAVSGGAAHGLYRVAHEAGYADGLVLDTPDVYTVPINGRTVTVSVTKLSSVPGTPPESNYDSKQRLYAEKVVTPTTATPGMLTTFTYTITVTNGDETSKSINQIVDELPAGFSYVAGTTTGLVSDDPTVVGQELEWDVASLGIDLAPQEAIVLSFDAQASVPEGVYCNETWVRPGDANTSSGKTAEVTVGAPALAVCDGTAARVTKTVDPPLVVAGTATTFTYSIVIDNIGATPLNVSDVRDVLPAGFLYVAGSTAGDLTLDEPSTKFQQGRQRLDWAFSPPVLVPSGASRTLLIDADATPLADRHWNEAWVTFDELPSRVATGQTAPIDALGPTWIAALDAGATASTLVWVGDGYFEVTSWDLEGL